MTGFFWHIFIYCIVFVFLVLLFYRVFSIVRLPLHLRWELAPIPHEKERAVYGGSYLEEFEWWHKKRKKSLSAVIIYMAGEIFLLRGIWKNNRGLWPFSFALHVGLYLVIISVILHIINALFIITGAPVGLLDVFRTIAAVFALAGYFLGSIGAVGLILKRSIDINFRAFSSFQTYFKLAFLAAIFISGIIAWFSSGDFAAQMSLFTRDLFTLDAGIAVTAALAAHIIIAALFLVYLPLTDMAHFITKYFTYHAVRWDDEPKDEEMVSVLNSLLGQPVGWSATHVKADNRKNWLELTTGNKDNAEKA